VGPKWVLHIRDSLVDRNRDEYEVLIEVEMIDVVELKTEVATRAKSSPRAVFLPADFEHRRAAHFAQGQQKNSTLNGVGMAMLVQPSAESGVAPVHVVAISEALHGSSQPEGPQI